MSAQRLLEIRVGEASNPAPGIVRSRVDKNGKPISPERPQGHTTPRLPSTSSRSPSSSHFTFRKPRLPLAFPDSASSRLVSCLVSFPPWERCPIKDGQGLKLHVGMHTTVSWKVKSLISGWLIVLSVCCPVSSRFHPEPDRAAPDGDHP